MTGESSRPVLLEFYSRLTRSGRPVIDAVLNARLKRGKEDPHRIDERRGIASRARPEGALVWIHAVSVGEAISVLPLIEALRRLRRDISVLLTTGTITSAQLISQRVKDPHVIHQYAPLDHPAWVEQFLDEWSPDLGLIVESELWPNLLLRAAARNIPLVLLNARLSTRSYRNWKFARRSIEMLLGTFTLCLAQDAGTAARLRDLGAANVQAPGNLKYAAPPLPDNQDARTAFETALGQRPCWLAASTHPGEEDDVAVAHRLVGRDVPGVLTVIAPRHPERGEGIAKVLTLKGFEVARRAAQDPITPTTDIYLADTLGELGIFYRVAPVVFIGGTFAPRGGQNPLEPARLGCAIIHGPHTENFSELFGRFDDAGAAILVEGAPALSGAVRAMLADPASCSAHASSARALAHTAEDVLERTIEALTPLLPAPARSETSDARA